ncbi:hypothetical protein A3L08_02075 [Thermococcus pacificus]|uniref:Uncharacterized protein n=2 Tax=Thermococcus pacificus TaxID=71998 RepID=A0A218P609_9EURY|nr:hypothetical protein A3L08_02075 [Thermococcus pacificus]
MNYDTGECTIFGMMVYNTPCRVFSMITFSLGMAMLILFLAGRLRASFAVGIAYYSVTFFAAWTWALSAKVLASLGIFLSLIGLYSSPRDTETSRSLREATSLVIYALVFLIFLLSAVSYIFYFSWVCWDAYSGAVAFLCSLISYILIGAGLVSPLLWRKRLRIPALVALLPAVLFLDFAVKLLQFSRLLWALVAVLFAMELWGRCENVMRRT